MSECLLYSAGLDSFIGKQYLLSIGRKFDCIYFDLETKYSKFEIEKIESLPLEEGKCPVSVHYDFLKMTSLEKEDAYVPNRNFLLAIMANALGYNKIWINGSASDRICDNNKRVFDNLSKLLTETRKDYIEISSPFWDVYKEDMIVWYQSHIQQTTIDNVVNPAFELCSKTFSCYNPGATKHIVTMAIPYVISSKFSYSTKECLECPACFRKAVSIFRLGTVIPFKNETIIKKYENEFRNCIISTPRSNNTLAYIDALRFLKLL